MQVLFVCTANTCRSPMAEAYLRFLADENKIGNEVIFISAGTYAENGMKSSPDAIYEMAQYNVDLTQHCSQLLTVSMLDESDLVIAMTSMHLRMIGMISKESLNKSRLLMSYSSTSKENDIADPFGLGMSGYAHCFMQMKPALDNLFLDILSTVKSKRFSKE